MLFVFVFATFSQVSATVAFDYGFAQIVACPGTPVQVRWAGTHNIQETSGPGCSSGDIGAQVSGFLNAGSMQNPTTVVYSNDELSAAHGTTRYFKCDSHCDVAAARFEVSCPAGCQENYYGTPGSCVLCPQGKYTVTTGNTAITDCLDSYAPTSQYPWRAEIRNCGAANEFDPANCDSGTPICRHNVAGITSGVGQPVFSPKHICVTHGITTDNQGYSSATGVWHTECMYNEPCALDWGFGSNVKNLRYFFQYAIQFNQQLLNWDTSSVTNMDYMFQQAWAFDQDIGYWDTGDVSRMRAMFDEAKKFNQDIGNWDTSSVTVMLTTFNEAALFNQDLNWDTSSVTQMTSMFKQATAFNGDISNWDTSKVDDFSYMFNEASSFNGDLSSWDTSAATEFEQMFLDATVFEDDLSVHWDVTAATIVNQMFHNTAVPNGVYCWSTLDAGATGATNLYNNGATIDCPCIPQPCLNSGSCSNDPGGGYICDCTGTGFDGTNCENVHPDCVGHGCLNSGVCVPGGGSYTCSCAAGWEGTFCATDTDECAANGGLGNCFPVHSASCEDSLTDGSIVQGEYECICNPGYYNRPLFMNCETSSPCVATTTPTDDGTDGNFYCTAGGTISGFTGGCACVCNTGYSGAGCATVEPCVATANPSDDGTDGNFYCINAGTATGTTGNCGCDCQVGGLDSGYSGLNCQTADACVATSDLSHNSWNNEIPCLGGTVSGTTGNCACTCLPGYYGPGCSYASNCTESTDPSKDGTDGQFYCINLGVATGTTGNCGCDCKSSTLPMDKNCVPLPPLRLRSVPAESTTYFYIGAGILVMGLAWYGTTYTSPADKLKRFVTPPKKNAGQKMSDVCCKCLQGGYIKKNRFVLTQKK